jgi:hypothetical protein
MVYTREELYSVFKNNEEVLFNFITDDNKCELKFVVGKKIKYFNNAYSTELKFSGVMNLNETVETLLNYQMYGQLELIQEDVMDNNEISRVNSLIGCLIEDITNVRDYIDFTSDTPVTMWDLKSQTNWDNLIKALYEVQDYVDEHEYILQSMLGVDDPDVIEDVDFINTNI